MVENKMIHKAADLSTTLCCFQTRSTIAVRENERERKSPQDLMDLVLFHVRKPIKIQAWMLGVPRKGRGHFGVVFAVEKNAFKPQ